MHLPLEALGMPLMRHFVERDGPQLAILGYNFAVGSGAADPGEARNHFSGRITKKRSAVHSSFILKDSLFPIAWLEPIHTVLWLSLETRS